MSPTRIYTASGRSLAFIEDFIREAVLPLYANTHNFETLRWFPLPSEVAVPAH